MPEILQKAERVVEKLLSTELNGAYRYHNLKHTQRVVKSTKEILSHGNLSQMEQETTLLAAWFHDTGYVRSTEEHEKYSADIAKEFLDGEGYDPHGIKAVVANIMATHRGLAPKTEAQRILKDADTSHFAKRSYMDTAETLRKELLLLGLGDFSRKAWLKENIAMLGKEHRYYTDYAKEQWAKGKQKNLKLLKAERKAESTIAKKEALKAKYKADSPDRGIQTLFRVTLKNHITLSDIADTKANILLSVNAIIISLALSNLIPKLDNPSNDYLIYPTVVFVFFSVISMVLAVLATRPNITGGSFTKADVEGKKVNLLFFGNFHKMSLSEYEWAVNELVKDKEYIYNSLTKDLYFLGLVLHRKYKLLRWTYTIFMIGMIVSVLAFGISFRFFGTERIMDTARLIYP